jgi:hypothetical protein
MFSSMIHLHGINLVIWGDTLVKARKFAYVSLSHYITEFHPEWSDSDEIWRLIILTIYRWN